jgi:hypothetical protein
VEGDGEDRGYTHGWFCPVSACAQRIAMSWYPVALG